MAKTPQAASQDDLNLASAVLQGEPDAMERFRLRFQPALEGTLAARCKDPATKPAITEVAIELLGDCLVQPNSPSETPAQPVSLLRKYLHPAPAADGTPKIVGPLEAWLRRVALNRLMDWIDEHELDLKELDERTTAASGEESGSQDDEETSAAEGARESDVIPLVRDALEKGFAAAAKDEPLGLVSLRLVWLFGIQRRQLAVAWRRHQANVTVPMDAAMDCIRKKTLRHIRSTDPLLSLRWRDLLAICAKYPEIIRGPE